MNGRFARNQSILSLNPQAQEILAEKRVLIVGCGGLGGYVIEALARTGIGAFVLCDPDTFEVSNLNRQLYALTATLGMKKVQVAKERIKAIHNTIKVQAHPTKFRPSYLKKVDIVLDCLGGGKDRFFLESECEKAHIPLVSGGISGWSALITSKKPESKGLGAFMNKNPAQNKEGAEIKEGSPACTVMFAASMQVCETLQILCTKASTLEDKILMANIKECRFQVMNKK